MRPVPVEPFPKSQAYVLMEPSLSREADASRVTSRGGGPEAGVAVKLAVGGRLGGGPDPPEPPQPWRETAAMSVVVKRNPDRVCTQLTFVVRLSR